MGRYTYPHTIENGAGERITFLRSVAGPAGFRLEVENVVTPGSGPPMHVHHHQEEALTVLQGRIGTSGPASLAQFAGPGDRWPSGRSWASTGRFTDGPEPVRNDDRKRQDHLG